MIVRQEKPSDYDEVYELVKASFAAAGHCDGDEQDYLNDLRKRDVFIPELSLVAVDDERIVGQIVLSKTVITAHNGDFTELLLSPLCVHPNYFRRGVARALVDRALHIAAEKWYKAVFLCGEPKIYTKLGFEPSYLYQIYHIKDTEKTAQRSMVKELYNGALKEISGTIDTI
ncbi:MAG: N-acetyltransferase [Defluviitaleaceae bacterium]|nr:N-acetyltransferase [Defluviitaleaceae bacterium]